MRAWLAATALAVLAVSLTSPICAADVTVGVALPLSGPRQTLGLGMRQALDDAAAALNSNGGVLGSQVRLVVADDGCQSAQAETAARTLLAEAPRVIIGHPCSSAAVAAAPLYRAQGAIVIATGPRHPALTAPKPSPQPPVQTVFRLGGRDDRQGDAAAQWLLREAPGKRVAIIHDRTAYAREIVQAAQKALKAAGLAEPLVLPLVAAKADYPEIVAKTKALNAEAVFFAGYPEEAQIILDDLRRAGVAAPFLGSDSLAVPEFAQEAMRNGSVQVLMRSEPGDPAHEGSDGALPRRAVDALAIWVEAVQRANSLEPAAVGAALRGGTFETRFLGRVSFDANGDSREPAYGVARAENGTWTFPDK
jgi:branched-chain amino acid transport system substrate-binding protein